MFDVSNVNYSKKLFSKYESYDIIIILTIER